MTNSVCTDFHWIGETLMAKEFGEVVELCNVDWSGLDEFEAEHKSLIASAPELKEQRDELLEALEAMCEEFRGHDLPYGSPNYHKAIAAIAKAKGETL